MSVEEFNSTHYELNVRADQKPQQIKISTTPGTLKDENNVSVAVRSFRINYTDQVTRAESLIGWWKFDGQDDLSWEHSSQLNVTVDSWSPLPLSPVTWLDASDTDSFSKSGNSIDQWSDMSGNNHHARPRAGQPQYNSTGLNSLPTVSLDGTSLALDNSGVSFDNWDELHVFAVLYQTAFSHFSSVFGKTNHTGWADSNSHNFAWFLQIHRADKNSHKIWGPALNTSTGGNSYLTTSNDAIWTHSGFTGGPSVISISYSSLDEGINNFYFKINGKTEKSSALSGSIKSAPDLDFVIGGKSNGTNNWKGRISEFIIFDKKLDDINASIVENVLLQKWQISANDLPEDQVSEDYPIISQFADQSGGGLPFLLHGEQTTLNEDGKFLGALSFDGNTSFGLVPESSNLSDVNTLSNLTRTDELLVWWPFDGNLSNMAPEGSAMNLIKFMDSSEEDKVVTFTNGKYGQSILLENGKPLNFQLTNIDSLPIGNTPRTVSAWIKTKSQGGSTLYAGARFSNSGLWDFRIDYSGWTGGTLSLDTSGSNAKQTGSHFRGG